MEDKNLIIINITIMDKYSLSLRLFNLYQPFKCVYQWYEPIQSDSGLKCLGAGIFGITPLFCLIWAKLG